MIFNNIKDKLFSLLGENNYYLEVFHKDVMIFDDYIKNHPFSDGRKVLDEFVAMMIKKGSLDAYIELEEELTFKLTRV